MEGQEWAEDQVRETVGDDGNECGGHKSGGPDLIEEAEEDVGWRVDEEGEGSHVVSLNMLACGRSLGLQSIPSKPPNQ